MYMFLLFVSVPQPKTPQTPATTSQESLVQSCLNPCWLKENGTFSAGQNVDALGWGKVVWPNHFGSSHPSKFLSLEGCLSRAASLWPWSLAMFPSAEAALQMGNIPELLSYFAVPEDLWSAFVREAGAPGDDIRLLAALPGSVVAASLNQATLADDVALTAVQAAQVGLVWKLARRLMFVRGGGRWDDWVDEDPWTPASRTMRTTTPAERTSSTDELKEAKERTLKFTQVLDQGDDGEFEVLNEEDKMGLLQKFIAVTGSLLEEEEEPTIEQLSALRKKVQLGKPPYCDFGVFVPFGRKALRASKYRTWIPTAEGYVSKELPGPANFTQWRACYRVFTTAMLMLEACSLPPLHAYELYVEKLTRLYPDAWHLVYAADEMARSELLSRLKLRIAMDKMEGKKVPLGYDEKKPWETPFRMIPSELKFWQDQIHGPALTWMAAGSKGRALTPQETIAQGALRGGAEALQPSMESGAFGATSPSAASSSRRNANRDRKEAKKRKWQAEREELQRLRESRNDGSGGPRQGGKGGGKKGKGGKQSEICFSWNNGNAPCGSLPAGAECQNTTKRAHRCSSCGSPGHPAHRCGSKK